MFQNDLMDRKHEGCKLKRYLSCIQNLLDILQRESFLMIRNLINKGDSEQQRWIVYKAKSCYKDYVLKRWYRMYDNILIAKSGNILYQITKMKIVTLILHTSKKLCKSSRRLLVMGKKRCNNFIDLWLLITWPMLMMK